MASILATSAVTTIPVVTKVILDKVIEFETSKGKGLMNEDKQVKGHNKSIFVEEGQEFLKLIKKSDFKIMTSWVRLLPKSILCLYY